MLNYPQLENQIETHARAFAQAEYSPYLVLDNFLEEEIALEAFHHFPKMEEMDTLKDFRQYKAQDPAIDKFHPIFSKIIFQHLQSPRFLDLLTRITGIPHLHADPQLYASGLAQGENGSFLNVHIDNSSHPETHYYRRLNLLLYLNKNWTEEKGGHLELWTPDMSKSVAILPNFNRMVIFATSRTSWHSHRRVNTPAGDSRKSINLYYFTPESPEIKEYYHITSFRARPQEVLNSVLYPLDNWVRSTARKLRSHKDRHAVLFDSQKSGTEES
jgi:Rps23 Pro-64 3,4-dihydroxylase Tpa1-like proline 4-hydroxylase